MKKRVLITLALILILVLCFGGLALAAPPDHAGGPKLAKEYDQEKLIPSGLQGKGIPPGLQKKGGLPPGMQGRDILPPGIQMRFAEALEERLVESKLIISGDRFIVIPDDEAITVDYDVIFIDENGDETIVTADWGFNNNDEIDGVSFENGILEVSPDAESGTITISAVYNTGEEEFSKSIEVTVYSQEVTSVEISGPEYVELSDEDEAPLVVKYNAVVKDQEDRDMEKEVTWVLGSDDYEYIDLDNGEVTLSELPEEDLVFTLKAIYVDDEAYYDELEVTVYYPYADEVLITGDEEIAIPLEGEIEKEYKALVVDQLNREIQETEVEWYLTDENGEIIELNGVELDNGELVVTGEAEEGSFWLWAVYEEDVFGTFEVTLYHD